MRLIEETPWNACDRRCERCPLSPDCRLYASDAEARAQARKRGLEPDDPVVALRLVGESLAKALELATQAAEEMGISLADLEPAHEPPKAGDDFAKAGREYADAVHEMLKDTTANAWAHEALTVAFIVGAKTARLTFDLPVSEDDPARDDTTLNLLLVDALLRQSRVLLRAASMGSTESIARLEAAAAELRRQLDAHLRSIAPEERQALVELIRAGRAPSPFCVITLPTQASA